MHSTKHASSSVQALYRVFVLPALSRPASYRSALASPSPHRNCELPPPPTHRRPFSHTSPKPAQTRPPETRTHKWNNEIRAFQIRLVDPSTGGLGPIRTKYDVLSRMDEKTHRLVQLSADPDPPDPDSPEEAASEPFIPVCQVLSKKEVYEQEKRKKAQTKIARQTAKLTSEQGAKMIELNWAIDPHNDLVHRMGRLREFLEQGRRVEVVLASKKRGRKASTEECEKVLGVIEKTVEGVEGARVKEERTGRLGGFMTMVFQGSVKKGKVEKKEVQQEEQDGADEQGEKVAEA